MAYGIGKRDNEYARSVCDVDATKTVWMAIAVSFALRLNGDEDFEKARTLIIEEWGATLHANNIVPQPVRAQK